MCLDIQKWSNLGSLRYSPARTPTPCTRPSAPGRVPRSTAYELDAADGVIDGKFYGRPIVQSPGTADLQPTLPAFEVTIHDELPLQLLLLLLLQLLLRAQSGH